MAERHSAEYVVVRHIPVDEAGWLPIHLRQPGARVFEFHGATYGCINYAAGFAVSERPGENPFYEMPHGAVERLIDGDACDG